MEHFLTPETVRLDPIESSSFPKKQAYSHTEVVNHLSAQGTFDLEVASECFTAISGFATGFHSRFQAPPVDSGLQSLPTSSSSILYFRNHTLFPESRPHL
jgi:hypothetical protein